MDRFEVEIRDIRGNREQYEVIRADGPLDAATKLYRRKHKNRQIGLAEHFEGGDTWHIQWGLSWRNGAMSLDSKRVVSIRKVE